MATAWPSRLDEGPVLLQSAVAIEREEHAPALTGRLAVLGERNVEEMIGWLSAGGIDCGYEPTGRLLAALTDGQVEEGQRAVATARRLGIEGHEWLDRSRFRERIDSPLFLGGVRVRGGGILDPVRLVDGLQREAERRGVRIHERSGVERLGRAGARVELDTGSGSVRARRAVIATSAYTHRLLPRVLHRFIPLYDYILVSEPLTGVARAGGSDGRAQLLQLLSSDRRRPHPLGHERGSLLLR